MLEVDRYSLETSREKFYAGGDLITGASNISNAMGYGKKAARNIDAAPDAASAVRRRSCRSSTTTSGRRTPTPGAAITARELPPCSPRAKTFDEATLSLTPEEAVERPAAACAAISAKPATTPSPSQEKPSCPTNLCPHRR